MIGNFENSLKKVLAHEGGFSDHPSDPGGATMKGVTLAVYRSYYGASKTKQQLKTISQSELEVIYRRGYWDKCKCDDLPKGLDYAVFDFAVNSGASRAVKTLQRILQVAEDGSIGHQTMIGVAKWQPLALAYNLCDARIAFLRGLKTFATFGEGWTRRVSDVENAVREMTK